MLNVVTVSKCWQFDNILLIFVHNHTNTNLVSVRIMIVSAVTQLLCMCFTVHILGCFYGQLLEQLQCCLIVRPYCLHSVFIWTADSGQIYDDDDDNAKTVKFKNNMSG